LTNIAMNHQPLRASRLVPELFWRQNCTTQKSVITQIWKTKQNPPKNKKKKQRTHPRASLRVPVEISTLQGKIKSGWTR
jgi:hypothetical protein